MSTQDRRPYQTATSLTQDVLDNSADNLVQKLQMIAEIQLPNLTLYVSDRAKFVGDRYYEPRINFPTINKTIGDWLAGVLEFPSLDITVNNADRKFNDYLPGGSQYDGFIGSQITVKVGLNEIVGSYITIFDGNITDVGGFGRDRLSFSLTARPRLEKVNVTIPQQVLIDNDWPDIEDNFIGLAIPVIYGDYTIATRSEVPAYPVNGKDPLVNNDFEDPNAGNTDLTLIIASTPIKTLDTSRVTLFRGDQYYVFSSGDITIIPSTNNTAFKITQKNLLIDGNPWIYENGDEFFVSCVGVDLGLYDNNSVSQAKDMLERFGGLTGADFDSNWDTYRDKSTPAESAIVNIKSRAWIQDQVNCFEYALSILEQVRLEIFVDRNNKFRISSLHFDDFEASPIFKVKNWDLVEGTLKPQVDDRNNFNRVKADFNFLPPITENGFSTPLFKNQAAITQAGRPISKLISYPNMYDINDVIVQLKEVLKLASGYTEIITTVFTPRMFLLDIGDYVKLDIDIGSIVYKDVPCLIRSIGYDPQGLSIPVTLWSFQLIDFNGYTAPSGSTGGISATIEQET